MKNKIIKKLISIALSLGILALPTLNLIGCSIFQKDTARTAISYEISSNGDLIIKYNDNEVENLGKITIPKAEDKTAISFSLNDENHLIITYNDNSTQDLGKTNLEIAQPEDITPDCQHSEKQSLVSNLSLKEIGLAKDNQCKISVEVCMSCGNLISTYSDHEEWEKYEIDSTTTTLGERGNKCKTCGYKKDIEVIPVKDHDHKIESISDIELNQYVLKEYGKIPSICEEIWYSNGSACKGCGLWFAKQNEPLGHILSTDLIKCSTVTDRDADRVVITSECKVCYKTYMIEDFGLVPSVSNNYFTVKINNDSVNCNVEVYLKPLTLTVESPDKFFDTDEKTKYVMTEEILVYEHKGTHTHKSGIPIASDTSMTKTQLEALDGSISSDGSWGVLHCITCGGAIIVNITPEKE